MKPLEWVSQLAVGHPTVDTQHQRLFAIYNQAFSADEKDLDRETLLGELLEYTDYHFADEEQLMDEVRYPEADRELHKRLHRQFLADLENLKDQPVYEILDFFREWLLRHIMVVDRKVGQFLKDHPPEQLVLGSADIFTFAFQDNPAAMALTDLTTHTMVDVNKAFEKLTGRPRAGFVGKDPTEINVWADLADRKRLLGILESEGEFASEEMRFLGRDGELHLGLASGKTIRVEGRKCMLFLFVDTTERSRTEKALLDYQSRFETVFRHGPLAMLVADPETGKILDTNASLEAMAGFTQADMVGKTSVELGFWGLEERDQVIRRVITDGSLQGKEFRFLDKLGRNLWTRCSFRMIDWEGQKAMLAVLEDISAEKAAEETRKRYEVRLLQAQKLDDLGKLAGTIAHDFNNILAGILGNLDLIRLQGGLDPLLEKRLETVHRGSLRARDLVQQILVFSRRQIKEKASVDLAPLVREVAGLLGDSFPDTVDISFEVVPGTLPVAADPVQVHQILMNLGTNAAQALGTAGGRVTFRLGPGPGPDKVCLEVADTGPGIDPQVLPHIFDPFFTTKAPGKGTGLGLSVVKKVVGEHRGTLSVESIPGAGTTFKMVFPGAPVPDLPFPSPDDPLPRGDQERILLVDDNRVLLDSTASLLELLGYQVVRHQTPEGALADFTADAQGFDLVFTDLTMPGTDGIAFVEQLQVLRPGVPILLASGFLAPGSTVLFRSLGIAGYIAKPFQVSDLARSVRTVLDQRT